MANWWDHYPWRNIQTNLRERDMEDMDAKAYVARLKELGEERADRKARPRLGDRIVGVVEYRDGSVIDVVRQKLDGTEA